MATQAIGRVVIADPLDRDLPGWDSFVSHHRLGTDWRYESLRAAAWTSTTACRVGIYLDPDGAPAALFSCLLLSLTWPQRFVHDGQPQGPLLAEVQLPLGGHPGFVLSPSIDDMAQMRLAAAFTDALRRQCNGRLLGLTYRHVGQPDLAWLATRGSAIVHATPNAVLENRWRTTDDYLASLHHKRRNSIRRIGRRVASDGGIVLRTESRICPARGARLVELVRSRHRRGCQLQAPVPEAHIDAMAADPDTWFTTYRTVDDGRLLAFAAWRDTPDAILNGLWGTEDPSTAECRGLYFHAAFESVRAMIDRGRPRLVMGKGMADVKATFGARLDPQYTVVQWLGPKGRRVWR